VRVVVDLSSGAVSLEELSDMERFSVLVLPAAPGDATDAAALGAVAAALSVHDAGTVDLDGNAFIPLDVVLRLADEAARAAGSSPDPAWEARFSSMVDQARTRGWVSDEGAIRAHIEWGRP
jgi:hypothetical protein